MSDTSVFFQPPPPLLQHATITFYSAPPPPLPPQLFLPSHDVWSFSVSALEFSQTYSHICFAFAKMWQKNNIIEKSFTKFFDNMFKQTLVFVWVLATQPAWYGWARFSSDIPHPAGSSSPDLIPPFILPPYLPLSFSPSYSLFLLSSNLLLVPLSTQYSLTAVHNPRFLYPYLCSVLPDSCTLTRGACAPTSAQYSLTAVL